MNKFTESKLEQAFIELLQNEGYPHFYGNTISRAEDEVLIEEDLKQYLQNRYEKNNITENEIQSIILQLKSLPSSDLYESNKKIMRMLTDGFSLKREDRSQKDIWIYLIDYSDNNNNIYKFVNQLEITGNEKRIPDEIIYKKQNAYRSS